MSDTDKNTCTDACSDCGSRWSCFIQWDKVITERLSVCSSTTARWSSVRPVMRLLEYSGHGFPWILGDVILILVLHQIDLQQTLMNLLLALLVDIIVCASVKAVFRRKRPEQNSDDMLTISVDRYSFPSGHATRVAMCACFLISQFDLSREVQSAILVWAVVVCISRVMLGRHHVSDVLAGALIGVLEFLAMNAVPIWLTKDTVEHIIRPIQEELHL